MYENKINLWYKNTIRNCVPIKYYQNIKNIFIRLLMSEDKNQIRWIVLTN